MGKRSANGKRVAKRPNNKQNRPAQHTLEESQENEESQNNLINLPPIASLSSRHCTGQMVGPPRDGILITAPEDVALLNLSHLAGHVEMSSKPAHTSGGFCDVFVGHHSQHGKVALKRPRISNDWTVKHTQQFIREIRFWKSLSHPSILPFLGAYKLADEIYMVSPYLSNGNLGHSFKFGREIDRFQLSCSTASAVAYLHDLLIVPGHIKAANALISDDGRAVLSDFGLAKLASGSKSTAVRGAGTTRWQSPELWEGDPKTFESDIYAFAMLIVEVLTGGPSFRELEADTAAMKAVVIYNARPSKIPERSPSGISRAILWDIAELCWVVVPKDRLRAGQLLQLLSDAVQPVDD